MVTQIPTINTHKSNHPISDKSSIDNYPYLSHMEKMVALGQLASSVAHEMRNLLGMIRTATYNIDRSLQSNMDASTKKNLDIITRNVTRAKQFIDNLLNLSRVSGGSEEIIDISEIVENLLTLFSKELEWRKIELERHYNHMPLLRIDRNAIQECLLNLLLNAIQCMDQGGKITVRIEKWNEAGVSITVSDTGPGIPQENLEKIFDRFYTTKKNGQGTGLGLTIARSIARDLGGDIFVQSSEGEGSAFSIQIASIHSHSEHENDPVILPQERG